MTANANPSVTVSGEASYLWYRDVYTAAESAARYPDGFDASHKGRADRRAVVKALRHVPAGASLLDLPCGSGRLTPLLLERGFRVTGADISQEMIDRSQSKWKDKVPFVVADVMDTGFADKQFDALICNRLFHHFYEVQVRTQALREFARICSGPIIVSFFNSFAVDTLQLWVRRKLGRVKPLDRVPIRLADFIAEGASAGLVADESIATRWGVSPLWYVVFRPH